MKPESVILDFEELYKNMTLMEFTIRMEMFKREYDRIRVNQYVKLGLVRRWQKFIYSLNMETYKKDRIWEYLNGDVSREDFKKFVRGVYYGR